MAVLAKASSNLPDRHGFFWESNSRSESLFPALYVNRWLITVFTRADHDWIPVPTVRNRPILKCKKLLAPVSSQAGRPPLSAVRDCLFSTPTAACHIWRPSVPSARNLEVTSYAVVIRRPVYTHVRLLSHLLRVIFTSPPRSLQAIGWPME
jgi:hypothetical protein